jgi:hypothetical protein
VYVTRGTGPFASPTAFGATETRRSSGFLAGSATSMYGTFPRVPSQASPNCLANKAVVCLWPQSLMSPGPPQAGAGLDLLSVDLQKFLTKDEVGSFPNSALYIPSRIWEGLSASRGWPVERKVGICLDHLDHAGRTLFLPGPKPGPVLDRLSASRDCPWTLIDPSTYGERYGILVSCPASLDAKQEAGRTPRL